MTKTALSGPLVIMKSNPAGSSGASGSANQNPQEAPSPMNQGMALLDPRFQFTQYPGSDTLKPVFMFIGGGDYVTINAVPATANAANIFPSASPGATTPLTLTAGAGVTAGASVVNAVTGALVTGLFAIDGAMTPLGFGQDKTYNVWDPSKAVSRAIRYVSGGVDTGITFTCTGFDVFGFPMSETVTGASGATATGTKAFKYIQSITHTGTVAGTLTIGTTDIIGLPIRSDIWADVVVNWNATWGTTPSTGYVAAVTTSPATATTGDVRGTINVANITGGSASDGTKRLVVFQSPIAQTVSPMNLATVTGLFGVAQNTSANNGT